MSLVVGIVGIISIFFIGSIVLAGRNHYRGRSADNSKELTELRASNVLLIERNESLARENKALTDTLASLHRTIESMSKMSIVSNTLPENKKSSSKKLSSEDDNIFINPMSDASELSKSFDELGETKKESLSEEAVEKLRKLLGR